MEVNKKLKNKEKGKDEFQTKIVAKSIQFYHSILDDSLTNFSGLSGFLGKDNAERFCDTELGARSLGIPDEFFNDISQPQLLLTSNTPLLTNRDE